MTAADLRPFPWRHTHGATMTESESDDVVVVVYREDATWDVDLLPHALTEDLAGLIQVLRQQPSIGGTIGLAAVGDDFFVAIRVIGGQASVFLSDLTAAVDWPLAGSPSPLPGTRQAGVYRRTAPGWMISGTCPSLAG